MLALAAAVGVPPAVAAAPSAAWALSPVGPYQYTLAPGGTAAGAVALINRQAQPQTLTLYSADMLSIAGGGFTPAPEGTAMSGVGAWLGLGETTVTVPAQATVDVSFSITVPPAAAPGQYDGAVVATVPVVPGSGGGMAVSTRTALTVSVAVPLAAATIGAGGETDLDAPDGSVRVVVPAGALPAGASLTVTPTPGGPVPVFPALPAADTAIAGPFALRAADATGNPLTVPQQPLTVSLRLPAGDAASGILLFAFDPTLHAWLPLPTSASTPSPAGSVEAQVARLTGVAAATDPALSVYPDVAGGWEEGSVLALEALGDVSGYPDGTFRPDQPVTRAEFAALLQRALGLSPGSAPDLAGFSDAAAVPGWALPALAAAVQAHLLAGEAGGALDPGGVLSRAEAAVIAARALGQDGGQAVAFSDAATIPAWAAQGVDAAVGAGLLDGYPDGSFQPLQPVTRAEAAALVLRLIRRRAAA